MWRSSVLVLLPYCAPALAFSVLTANVPVLKHPLAGASHGMGAEQDLAEGPHQSSLLCDWPGDWEAGQGELVSILTLEQCSEGAGEEDIIKQPEEGPKAITQDQIRGSRSSDSPCASSAQAVNALGVEYAPFEASYAMGLEELFAEWDETPWPFEWQDNVEAGQGVTLKQCSKGDQVVASVGNVTQKETLGIVEFVRPKTPEDFVELWPKQRRLVQSLQWPLAPEQRRMLWYAYYPFAPAGRLLDEIGEAVFLQRFGGGPVDHMQRATAAEIKQRRVAEKGQKAAEVVGGESAEEEGVSEMEKFVTPESPEDFVKRWPEQKRLFQGLLRPLSPEQNRILTSTYYKFAAAGQLLDELGEKKFLKRFGKGTANEMRLTAGAKIRQRKAVERDQKVTESMRDIQEGKTLDLATFVSFKSPEDFVRRWLGLERLAQSLSYPLAPEQRRILQSIYHPFMAAGQLLRELGEEAFLHRFGGKTATKMVKITRAEIRQRKVVEEDWETAEGGEYDENEGSGVMKFVRSKSPEDFVRRWPKQKRLYESLPHPLTPEQVRVLRKAYFPFTAAGKLFEELGEKEFLQKFGRSTANKMQESTTAEMRQRRAVERDQRVAESVRDADEGKTLDITKFVSFKSPKDFVKRWSGQKRLVQSLPQPITPEQKRALNSTFYKFRAAGQLLEELGGEAFLQKFGGRPITKMMEAARAEAQQRQIVEKEQEMATDLEEAQDIGVFLRPKSPKGFARRWAGQKRLFESLPRPLTPEEIRTLANLYYPYRAAGQLLEELGEETFLEKFGGGSVGQMRKATVAVLRQRELAEKEQEAVIDDAKGAEEEISDIGLCVRPKSPKGFVKRWPKQKLFFKSLPRPLTTEQKRAKSNLYYPFVAAGRLLDELGEEAFLQKFGKGSADQMQKAAVVEVNQRTANGYDWDLVTGDGEGAEKEDLFAVTFVRPKSPRGFVRHWPKQKLLFESLPSPRTPGQTHLLQRTYYPYVAAGRLLDELGDEAFLQKFGKGTLEQMRKATVAEIGSRRAGEEGRRGVRGPAKAKKDGGRAVEGSAKAEEDGRRAVKGSMKVKKDGKRAERESAKAKRKSRGGSDERLTEGDGAPNKSQKKPARHVKRKEESESDESLDSTG